MKSRSESRVPGPWFGFRHWGFILLMAGFLACNSRDSVPQSTSQAGTVATNPTAEVAQSSAPLPRDVDALKLAMSRGAVEAQIGALDCHTSDDGVNVCHPVDASRGRQQLQLFFFHDVVVSIAYEIPPPSEIASHLAALVDQYGQPSLNGMTQRDANNRMHEVYGWRDTSTLYSTRFVWEESPPPPRLISTVITIWDRAAYARWEDEKSRSAPVKNDSSKDRLT